MEAFGVLEELWDGGAGEGGGGAEGGTRPLAARHASGGALIFVVVHEERDRNVQHEAPGLVMQFINHDSILSRLSLT